MTTKLSPTQLITSDVRLSFPHLFTPKAYGKDGKLVYSCTLLLPPGTSLKPFVESIKAAMMDKFQAIIDIPKSKNPIHDCATYPYPNARYEGYDDGWIFLRVSSKYRPPVVDRMAVPIDDPDRVYAGMWVRAHLNAYGWTYNNTKSVSLGLNGIQLVRDGDRLDGRVSGPDAFETLGDEEVGTESGDTSVDEMFR